MQIDNTKGHKMDNLSLIKWHAQELCILLEQDNAVFAELSKLLESSILNAIRFRDIEASPPTVADE